MIRLVPEEPPRALSIDAACDAANAAYTRARAAQRELVADLYLTKMLYRPGKVSYTRLRGEQHAAAEQCGSKQREAEAETHAALCSARARGASRALSPTGARRGSELQQLFDLGDDLRALDGLRDVSVRPEAHGLH